MNRRILNPGMDYMVSSSQFGCSVLIEVGDEEGSKWPWVTNKLGVDESSFGCLIK